MFYRKNKLFKSHLFLNSINLKSIILIGLFVFSIQQIQSKTYFVSLKGKNSNKGTISSPFYSIQLAAKKLKPGDTLYIREGNYSENCQLKLTGKKGVEIVISNYKNEKVIFTPSRRKLHWKKISKNIYRTNFNDKITQLFINEKPIFQASFPNIEEGSFNKKSWAKITAFPNKTILFDKTSKHPSSFTNARFVGICGRGTIAITGNVIYKKGNSISIQNNDFYWDKRFKTAYLGKGRGYFVGNISFLDTTNEWFSDGKHLYFYGKPPIYQNTRFRSEKDIFRIYNSQFVTIKGVNFIGKSLKVENSKNCILNKIKALYPTPFFNFEHSFDRFGSKEQENPEKWSGKGLIINGENNKLTHSIIAHSWGDGLTLYGKNNSVFNTSMSDCNWMGTDAAALNLSGENHLIKHCFLSKTGRTVLLHRRAKKCKILYNEISEGGYICDDLGLTYTYDTDGFGTEIAYNWLHHNRAPHYGSGIYLDNNHSNFKVHHNVVWKCFVGMTINQIAQNDFIYNNTFIKNKYSMGSAWFTEYSPIIKNVTSKNNLTDSDLTARDQQPFYGTIQTNNKIIPHLTNFLENPSINDFRINKNRLDSISNLGAYETANKWKAGLIFPIENNIVKPFNQTAPYQFITYIVILMLLSVFILKTKFYKLKNIHPNILFGITILSGIAYWMIFTYLYPNRETAEIFKHFDDAHFIYTSVFQENKTIYFDFLLTGNTPSFLKDILHQTNFWFYQTQPGQFGDNHLLIKFHAWIMPLSGGNIFIHLLLFSFIGFNGLVAFFKLIEKSNLTFNSISLVLFAIPSFWLFATSGTKDSILFCAIALLFYTLDSFSIKKLSFWAVLIGGFYLLILLRPYLFIAFIPYFGIQLLTKLTKKQFNGLITFTIYLITFIILLQINKIQLFDTLKFKQQDLILVAKEMHASTSFEITPLTEPIDLLKNSISGIYNVFFKPLISKSNSTGLFFMQFENWSLILIFSLAIYQSIKQKKSPSWNLFFWCILVVLFIGWTIPISGVIIRFRALALPFLLLSLFSIKNKESNVL